MNPGTLHTSWFTSRRLDDTADDLLFTAAGPEPEVLAVLVDGLPCVLVAATLVVLALPMLNPDTHINTQHHDTDITLNEL